MGWRGMGSGMMGRGYGRWWGGHYCAVECVDGAGVGSRGCEWPEMSERAHNVDMLF